jgi:hypothetical protein
MKLRTIIRPTIGALFAISVAPTTSRAQVQTNNQVQTQVSGTAVAYPWAFENGTETARKSVYRSASEIARRANFSVVPHEVAHANWTVSDYRKPTIDSLISTATLQTFGQSLKANVVIYGSTSWHTRSIWVNAGPKTISTATVNVYVVDVATGATLYNRTKVEGRSDEKSNILKVAGAILFTPLVTGVSGGPAAPQEERASQIAMAKAFADWDLLPRQK